MNNKKKWETRSLEWIHNVRENMDNEIKKKKVTLAQWVRTKAKIDCEELRKKFGLIQCTVDKIKTR